METAFFDSKRVVNVRAIQIHVSSTGRGVTMLFPTWRSAVLVCITLLGPPARAAGIVATVTDQDGKPLADAVVTVQPRGATPMPPAASLQLASAMIDQQEEMFMPTVVVIHTGGSVVFRNSDRTRHHVYSFAPIKQFEFVQRPGDSSPPVRFDTPGSAAIGCNIHDNMVAYVYVTDAPWAAVTDQNGRATVTDLPAGNFTATVWHARLRPAAAPPSEAVSIGRADQTVVVALAVLPPRRPHSKTSIY
jgi:plastocyanin